jgi:hypothetical protein
MPAEPNPLNRPSPINSILFFASDMLYGEDSYTMIIPVQTKEQVIPGWLLLLKLQRNFKIYCEPNGCKKVYPFSTGVASNTWGGFEARLSNSKSLLFASESFLF